MSRAHPLLGVDVAVVPADGLLDPVRAHLPERDPSFCLGATPGPGPPVRGGGAKRPGHEPGGPVGRKAAAARSLRDTGLTRIGEPCSLQWIYVHMIEEYARHNRHAT
jgi:uncharacterized protein DUF664